MLSDKAVISRVFPFALFMAFIAVDETVRTLAARGIIPLPDAAMYYLYPIKMITVAASLYLFRHHYYELHLKDIGFNRITTAICAVGVLTCVMWVYMDWTLPITGTSKGFNPNLLPEGIIRIGMTLSRVAGAVLVVPLMEELFWRSFLLRYLVDSRFESVELGRFTWGSFLATTLLFGLEHHLVFAGMAAGAIYSAILYKTRSLAQCVLAHAVTNLALAGYVLYTGNWQFW